MSTDFDKGRVYFADMMKMGGSASPASIEARAEAAKLKFRRFLEHFTNMEGEFVYREQLRKNAQMRRYFLPVEIEHLIGYDETLAMALQSNPVENIEAFEAAAKEIAAAAAQDDAPVYVQIEIRSQSMEPMGLRTLEVGFVLYFTLQASKIGKLVRIAGIIVTASAPMARPISLTIACKVCLVMRTITTGIASLNGTQALPRTCPTGSACGLDPWVVFPERSSCVDQQSLKLQELPESVPVGELPRHILVIADREHVGKTAPGKRVLITGIYCTSGAPKGGGVALRFPFVKVVGMEPIQGGGDSHSVPSPLWTTDVEAEARRMVAFSRTPNIYEHISRSIAPSLFGHEEIKKSIACLLFGGTRKSLPDRMRIRGDINVLILGDPGTAKSQLLKVVERIAPIAIYTSGKGSSAAGLTATVVRDTQHQGSGEFYLEGGAMVLADGGIVCIDEFDKMREEDRVAIHEAMEQQTISIAKAGITTILNARTSVLAAANPAFGRYDETRAPGENIDFSTTILSRFDMIFIVKDEHSVSRDTTLARHVVGIHMTATGSGSAPMEMAEEEAYGDPSSELVEPEFLRSYIAFCRARCTPRLSQGAAALLIDYYVRMRSEVHEMEVAMEERSSIPITVRQLEAIVRIAESLAKMELLDRATEAHVSEAIRLFRISTLNAVHAGHGGEAMPATLIAEIERVERAIKQRLPLGSSVAYASLLRELVSVKRFSEPAVLRAIDALVAQETLLWRTQRRVIVRANP